MCFSGAVVASRSLTQEWHVLELLITNIFVTVLNSMNSMKAFRKNSIEGLIFYEKYKPFI